MPEITVIEMLKRAVRGAQKYAEAWKTSTSCNARANLFSHLR
jgi:hypothetical protein